MAHAVTLAAVVAGLGTWGWPGELPGKLALGLAGLFALLAVSRRGRSLFEDLETRHFLALASLAAALGSLYWIAHYLRGGPRIIDATSYFLQGRALSHGAFAWEVPEPAASFRGRFLYSREPGIQGGIFPPGYPLLLAGGWLLGAPMLVGPVLAGLLVWSTHALTRALAEATPSVDRAHVEPLARVAVLLSVACAALRYHTADTMSHGATALGISVACWLALRQHDDPRRRLALAMGLALGFVLATRPVSALAATATCAWLVRARPRSLGWAALGALPFVVFLLASQHAVTGHWFGSTQRAYYLASDGPPGCFRWGFGVGTGCLFEHGQFTADRLPHGFGALEALGTTLRRLRMHVADVANVEPLALLVLAPLLLRGKRAVGPLLALVALHVAAYAPFYFDGNYPGGGGRFFADLLPVEHALAATALGGLFARRWLVAALVTLSLAALGFAIHTSHDHERLAARDGGKPMFEPDRVARANVKHALVFVDTDHGFGLGHDPTVTPASGVTVARLRGDDHDRLLYERFDRPSTFTYRFPDGDLVPWTPPVRDEYRFEAEAEWPALSQSGGFAAPAWVDGCASGRALVLSPTPMGGEAQATLTVPVPHPGPWSIEVRIVGNVRVPHTPGDPAQGRGTLEIAGERWSWEGDGGCRVLAARTVVLGPRATARWTAWGGPVGIDQLVLRPGGEMPAKHER